MAPSYWAQDVGLTHSADVLASHLERHSIAMLAKCGAIQDVDPDTMFDMAYPRHS
jgi:hypothetical protein